MFFSPFEGFKIASWSFEFMNISQDYFYVTSNVWTWNLENILNNQNIFFSLFIFFILIFSLSKVVNSSKALVFDFIIFIEVLVFFLVLITFTFLGQSLFFYTQELSISNNDITFNSNLYENFIFEFVFNKDIWGFFLVILFFFLLSSGSLSNLTLFPKGDLDHFANSFYTFSLDLFSSTLELKTEKQVQQFQEFFWKTNSIFGFIFVANSVGMIPFSTTITSNLTNTFFIALTVFFVVLSTMILEKGITHFFDLFLPSGTPFMLIPLLIPIEILSYSFRLVSLSVRLFANMLAGHTLMKVFSGFSWSLLLVGGFTFTMIHYLPVLVLFALTVLELGVAAIQAYVFVVLSLLYIRDIFAGH